MLFKKGDKVKVIKTCSDRGCGNDICPFLHLVGIVDYAHTKEIMVRDFKRKEGCCSGFTRSCLFLVERINTSKPFGIVDFLKKWEK
jgi:hypothetical protein